MFSAASSCKNALVHKSKLGTLKQSRRGKGVSRASSANQIAECSRSFQYVPYGTDLSTRPSDHENNVRKTICCDGLVKGADLELTHWTGNATPAELYADLSTEIALNFIESGQSEAEEWKDAVVVNNHFDTDGVLSVWALLNPEAALAHRPLLVSAAAAGDFAEWDSDKGVKLDLALEGIAARAGGEEDGYSDALEQVGDLLFDGPTGVEGREDLWGEEWDALQQALEDVESGRVSTFFVSSIGVVVHPLVEDVDTPDAPALPGPVLSKVFGGPFSGVDRYLRAFPRKTDNGKVLYRFMYSRVGHAWTVTTNRPLVPKQDKSELIEILGDGWEEMGGLTGLVQSSRHIEMHPEAIALQLHSIEAQVFQATVDDN